MLAFMARNWWVLLIRGILAIVFGVLAFLWPGLALGSLVLLFGAYALLDEEGDAAKAGRSEAERYAEARGLAPDAMELVFWTALEHAKAGRMDDARREMRVAFAAPDGANWRATLEHLRDGGREGRALVDELLRS